MASIWLKNPQAQLERQRLEKRASKLASKFMLQERLKTNEVEYKITVHVYSMVMGKGNLGKFLKSVLGGEMLHSGTEICPVTDTAGMR